MTGGGAKTRYSVIAEIVVTTDTEMGVLTPQKRAVMDYRDYLTKHHFDISQHCVFDLGSLKKKKGGGV